MKTKLLRKLRRKYFNLYYIEHSDEKERWELYTNDVDYFDNCYHKFVSSAENLSDVQDHLKELVQGHIINYLKEKGRDPLRANKYLW